MLKLGQCPNTKLFANGTNLAYVSLKTTGISLKTFKQAGVTRTTKHTSCTVFIMFSVLFSFSNVSCLYSTLICYNETISDS